MSEQTPPYPYYNGIIYNSSLFSSNTSNQYLPRVGVATSSATSTTFNGQLLTSGVNDASTIGAKNLSVSGTLTLPNNSVSDSALSSNMPLKNGTNTFTGANSFVSPSFSGTPTAPTAPLATNTTQIATTEFVLANTGTALLASNNTWSGTNTFSTAPVMSGASISAASLPDSALTSNVALLNTSQTITSVKTYLNTSSTPNDTAYNIIGRYDHTGTLLGEKASGIRLLGMRSNTSGGSWSGGEIVGYGNFGSSGYGLKFNLYNLGTITQVARINESGYFGVGTTSPQTTISTGTSGNNVKIAVYDDGSGGNFYGIGLKSSRMTFCAGQSQSITTPHMSLWSSGFLGINTGSTAPSNELQVVGTIKATNLITTGTLDVTGIIRSNSALSLTSTSSVNYTQTSTLGFGFGGGGVGTQYRWKIDDITLNRDNGAGPNFDYGAQSKLIFSAKSNNLYSGGVNDQAYIQGLTLVPNSGGNGGLSSGINVGINTTNPTSSLHINGAGDIMQITSPNFTGYIYANDTGKLGFWNGSAVTWSASATGVFASYNSGVNTQNIDLVSSTGNNAGYASAMRLFTYLGTGAFNSITNAGDVGIVFGDTTSATQPGLVITPWANATSGIRITRGGSVGINKANPENTLDVSGTARIGDSAANNVHLNATPGIGQRSIWMTYSGTGASTDFGVLQAEHQGTAYRNLALNPYGANVGIGKTNPAYNLDVNGTMNVGSTLNLSLNSFGNCNTIPTTVLFNKSTYTYFTNWVYGSGSSNQQQPTISSSANVTYVYSVFGKTLFLNFSYHTNTAGTAGSGIYFYRIPVPSLAVDINFYGASSIFEFIPSGTNFTPNATFNTNANRLRGIRVGSGMCENMGSSNSATSLYLMRESFYTGDLVILVYSHTYGYQSSSTYEYSQANCAHSWTAQIPLK